MNKTAAFWDKLARRYAAKPVSNKEAYEQTLERSKQYLSETDRVLELGCGTGSTALLLAENVKDYYASDISSEMVTIGREKLAKTNKSNLHFLEAELNDTLLDENGPYDAIIAFNVIHLFDDMPDALERIKGLLKPEGVLISKTVCLSGWYSFLRVPIFFMQLVGKAPLVHFISGKKLVKMTEQAGFDVVEEGTFLNVKVQHFIVANRR